MFFLIVMMVRVVCKSRLIYGYDYLLPKRIDVPNSSAAILERDKEGLAV